MFWWFTFVPVWLLLMDHVVSDECGKRIALTKQLVNYGHLSRLGEWPWHAAVMHRMNRASPSYACGGTIITSNYILTAAHCTYPSSRVRRLNPSEILIRTGISHLQQLEHSLQQMAVAEITAHEDYNSDVAENDIAILKLTGELEFTDYVKPICVWSDNADEELIVGKLGYTAGWGRDEHGELPDQLQQAVMPIISRKECRDNDPEYYTRYLFDGRCFCAGFRNGTSPGVGDSGGGFYIELDGKWFLRGIVSNGKLDQATQLLDTSSYIVFTDVANFLSWISKNTGVGNAAVIQPIDDYSTCGKKKERQFSRQRVKEQRMWPWEGHVYRSIGTNMWLCQAAVINEYFLLSPAEVYNDTEVYDSSKIKVVFEIFKNGKNEVIQEQQVQRIIRHEEFSRESRKNNLALLKLEVPLRFSELIKPICLWVTDPTWAIIANSYGYTGEYQVNIYDKNGCERELNVNKSIMDNHTFCYYLTSYVNASTLPPDLLYIEHADLWYLRGITFNMINIYHYSLDVHHIFVMDLAYYSDWIEKNADLNSPNLLNLEKCEADAMWMFHVWSLSYFKCYAILITTELLLTTASCVEGIPVDKIKILSVFDIPSSVSKVHLHPSFDKVQLTDNIALIEIRETPKTRPICLPIKLSNVELYIAFQQFSRSLQKAMVLSKVITTNVTSCAKEWHREGVSVLTNGQHICGEIVMGAEEKKFLDCRSYLHGAPLIYPTVDRKGTFLRGLLDVGRKDHCENSSLPEIFVDVTFYGDWIRTIVKEIEHRATSTHSGEFRKSGGTLIFFPVLVAILIKKMMDLM